MSRGGEERGEEVRREEERRGEVVAQIFFPHMDRKHMKSMN